MVQPAARRPLDTHTGAPYTAQFKRRAPCHGLAGGETHQDKPCGALNAGQGWGVPEAGLPSSKSPSPFIHFLQNARASGSCPVTQV